jgi:hypothetical protein
MRAHDGSLRFLVEKWVSARPKQSVRFKRFRLTGTKMRYVRFEAICADVQVVMFFFRHADDSWCVFPPEVRRPTMDALHLAA